MGSKVYKNTIIIGGGPVGLLTSIFLAKRMTVNGEPVYPHIHVLEKRSSPQVLNGARSYNNYNLTLSHRGLSALENFEGLKEAFIKEGVFTKSIVNCLRTDDFSKGFRAIIHGERLSMQRYNIIKVLINYIEEHFKNQIQVTFDFKVDYIEFENKKIYRKLKEEDKNNDEITKELSYDILIGSDGVRSAVGLALRNTFPDIYYHRDCEPEPYAIANIPHSDLINHGINFSHETMYIVQSLSNNSNIIILPNKNSLGFAINPWCHLDNPDKGPMFQCFHTMKDSFDLYNYLILNYPNLGEVIYKNIAPLMGIKDIEAGKKQETKQELIKPKYSFESVYYGQYHHPSEPIILIGDAAHTMVPTVGQGINCGFEDVIILSHILNEVKDDWSSVPSLFTLKRKEDAWAIQKLSADFITEGKSKWFEIRRIFDLFRNILNRSLPNGWVQPNFMHLLSQTSTRYSKVLKIRNDHFVRGLIICSFSTLCLIAWLGKNVIKNFLK